MLVAADGYHPALSPDGRTLVFGKAGAVSDRPLAETIGNFYMTDPISRCSPTMARCTAEILGGGARAAAE